MEPTFLAESAKKQIKTQEEWLELLTPEIIERYFMICDKMRKEKRTIGEFTRSNQVIYYFVKAGHESIIF